MKDGKYTNAPDDGTVAIHDQHELLSVNRFEIPEIEDALPGFTITPLFLDGENGVWVIYVKVAPGGTVPTHFHTGPVHLYTLKGEWYYKEYPDDVQKEGSYLYEPGGSYHTLTSDTGAEFFNVVIGANVNFDEDGNFLNVMDAKWIQDTAEKIAEERGIELQYIIPGGGAKFRR
ncbi:2,4'-dihydroxyacetophenone dioxygenase family protein [Palleronia caenipelagi]|uniref:2,4'-dihydroxyacetophenone dioxygenase n=1 Tax=Palleronia caenipelagi TaxID=2489174 RepID=A0A547Q338_9RHOB|nr:2,4'-dihydroxyacetophenone dioxygenase family protein [Palleronia caenipelagi]TRD20795.1 2,4'-dihydroxyacetophenone dioxygenase [Palleronia caenipelagi]